MNHSILKVNDIEEYFWGPFDSNWDAGYSDISEKPVDLGIIQAKLDTNEIDPHPRGHALLSRNVFTNILQNLFKEKYLSESPLYH